MSSPTISHLSDSCAVDPEMELWRTHPDFVLYRPDTSRGLGIDAGNEEVHVFDGPDGSLMAVWTQMTCEGFGDHRVVFSRSEDNGTSWSTPMVLAGFVPPRPREEFTDQEYLELCREARWNADSPSLQASWAFPLVAKSGKIYVGFNQFTGRVDHHHQLTGRMDFVYSDDFGRTWSKPQPAPMRRSPYDHPDPAMPSNWHIVQKPERFSNGLYLAGLTRWLSNATRRDPKETPWGSETVIEFLRFENLDENPEPSDLRMGNFAFGDEALYVPHRDNPRLRVAQEPWIAALPDARLICLMRTLTGMLWYSLSNDAGFSWTDPMPLRRRDHGDPILHPVCTPALFPLADGRYFLIHHGSMPGTRPEDAKTNRQIAWFAVGEFQPKARQPIWFGESRILMQTDGVGLGYQNRTDTCNETSMTRRNGVDVLWYPDRKHFLLGKKITGDLLD